jgi:hypothetical protein
VGLANKANDKLSREVKPQIVHFAKVVGLKLIQHILVDEEKWWGW